MSLIKLRVTRNRCVDSELIQAHNILGVGRWRRNFNFGFCGTVLRKEHPLFLLAVDNTLLQSELWKVTGARAGLEKWAALKLLNSLRKKYDLTAHHCICFCFCFCFCFFDMLILVYKRRKWKSGRPWCVILFQGKVTPRFLKHLCFYQSLSTIIKQHALTSRMRAGLLP